MESVRFVGMDVHKDSIQLSSRCSPIRGMVRKSSSSAKSPVTRPA